MSLFAARRTALWAWIRARPSLWAVYAVFAAVAVRIDPRRFVFHDDDFAYARMVQHLLRTGRYRPDAWTAANLPFQVGWGALFSLPFGYSPGALRMSTIAVFVLALGCLYQLLRDHEVGEQEAGLLTFVCMAGPMVLQLAFSFMTDLHYLSWLVIALFFYARAFDPDRPFAWAPLLLGGLAGFAAVGTRQVGVALVGAVGALWLFDPDRYKRLDRYLVAVGPPLIALIWQYRLVKTQPTFSQEVRLLQQAAYMKNRAGLELEAWWRPTVLLQYVGWFLWPLFPVFLTHWAEASGKLRSALRSPARPVRPLLLAAAVWLFYRGNVEKNAGHHLMPSLEWHMVGIEGAREIDYRYRLHYGTWIFGALVIWLLLRRFVPLRGYPRTTLTDKLIGLVTAGMLVGNIAFFVIGDRYAIVYIPLCLWLIGRTARRWPAWTRALVLALGFWSLSSSMRWTYQRLEPETSYWALGEIALARGAEPRDVSETWQWQCYHGAYDDWIATLRGRTNVNLDEVWGFLGKRNAAARYVIADQEPGPSAAVVAVHAWRDADGKPRQAWLIDRRPQEPHR
jgi:hypothetical protein